MSLFLHVNEWRMFQVTREVDYGLLVLAALASHYKANPEIHVSLKDLAQERRLPYRFLSKIMIALKNARLVESQEGIHGGYRLARSPQEISIREVLNALNEDLILMRCEKGDQLCQSFCQCTSRGFWHQLQERIDEFVKDFTLADLIYTPRPHAKPNVLFERNPLAFRALFH